MTQPLSVERAARAGSPVRAVVHAAGVDTVYLRAGRGGGDAIVVVADDLEAPELSEVIATLQDRYLVLAASPVARNAGEFAVWFSGFLEGLGVSSAHLLVHSSKAMNMGDDHDV